VLRLPRNDGSLYCSQPKIVSSKGRWASSPFRAALDAAAGRS
jgi:hypothetical protein